MKPVVVIPTYNEKENVAAMASAVLSGLPEEGLLLFLDDNSPDGTGAIIDGICAAEPRVRVMHRERKEGLGRAYVAGFAEALRLGASHVVEMDCDFSHDPQDVRRLLETVGCLPSGDPSVGRSDDEPAGRSGDRTVRQSDSLPDVVIGSRYVTGGRCVGWPFRRWFVSYFGGRFIRLMLGTPVMDPTGGFKCFTRAALEKLGDFSSIRSFGYSFQMEMNYRMWKLGLMLKEIPIAFTERRAGTSKISGSIAAETLKMVFRLKFGR